ncbi:MAG: cytochrome ubiquinol oxidase subunit I, partial [bacterium]
HFLGVDGMPRRIYAYPEGLNFELWNLVSTLGAYTTAVAGLLFFINIFVSLKSGEKAPADPWDGRTIEWAVTSPPPEYNFAKLPQVEARDDFWYKKYETKSFKPEKPGEVLLPNPSSYPFFTAVGIALSGAGFLWGPEFLGPVSPISLVGVVVVLVSAFGWSFQKFEG